MVSAFNFPWEEDSAGAGQEVSHERQQLQEQDDGTNSGSDCENETDTGLDTEIGSKGTASNENVPLIAQEKEQARPAEAVYASVERLNAWFPK